MNFSGIMTLLSKALITLSIMFSLILLTFLTVVLYPDDPDRALSTWSSINETQQTQSECPPSKSGDKSSEAAQVVDDYIKGKLSPVPVVPKADAIDIAQTVGSGVPVD